MVSRKQHGTLPKLRKNRKWAHDKFTDDSGFKWNVHKGAVCQGSNCAIHSPSDHPLKDARIVLRRDGFKFGLAERICEHGIGHSDPDSVVFYNSVGELGMGVHGCDGCCTGTFEDLQIQLGYTGRDTDYDNSSSA